MIHTSALKSIYGQKVYNQISVKTEPGAYLAQVQKKADAVIGDDLIGITVQKDNSSVSSVNGRMQQFKMLSLVFPFLFFIVIALIARNTLKNKGRLIMSIIGVMGCVGVVIAALTIRSTISGLNEQM